MVDQEPQPQEAVEVELVLLHHLLLLEVMEFHQQSHHLLMVTLHVQLFSTLEEAVEELTKIQGVAAEEVPAEKAAEAEAQKAFDEFSSESAVNRAANAKDVEHKTTKKTNQEAALTAKKADLEGTQKELDAALAYYDKLKPSAFYACFFERCWKTIS